jgi:hypothetical protein
VRFLIVVILMVTSVRWATVSLSCEERTHEWYTGHNDHDRDLEAGQDHGEAAVRRALEVERVQLSKGLPAINRDGPGPEVRVSTCEPINLRSAPRAHPVPIPSKTIATSFRRHGIRRRNRYGIRSAIVIASMIRFGIPIE